METEIENIMVSVIIPNYNHALYLRERIESVLKQTYTDFELIILDDKSTDNSIDIIERYRDNPHVSIIKYNETNSGSTFYQWNKGVELAKGKYIWIAESDDVADTNFLETLLAKIETDDNIVLSYCQSNSMDSEGNITGDWVFQTKKLNKELFATDFVLKGKEFIVKYLSNRNVIPNASAVVFRKEAFEKVKGADEDIKYCSDWLLWLKMLMIGDITFTSQKLNYFRYHNTSVIARSTNDENTFKNKYNLLMRLRFKDILRKNNYNQEKKIIKTTKKYIRKEAFSAFWDLLLKGKVRKSILYLKISADNI